MPVTTIADLLTLLTREPGRPRITWYGDGGERVELSGAVLENWVNKTANLLVEEFDAAPGTRVRLDLPGHWRTVVWALAVWRVGACVTLGDGDVVVTDRPDQHAGAPQLVAVPLPALARRFDGPVPPGTVDAGSAVMTYADVIGWAPDVDGAAAALELRSGVVAHRDLLPRSSDAWPLPDGSRLLLAVPADRDIERSVLLAALSASRAGGSLVLVAPGAAPSPAEASGWLDRLAQAERVTVRPPD